jgi:hypothetical protein
LSAILVVWLLWDNSSSCFAAAATALVGDRACCCRLDGSCSAVQARIGGAADMAAISGTDHHNEDTFANRNVGFSGRLVDERDTFQSIEKARVSTTKQQQGRRHQYVSGGLGHVAIDGY